MSAAGPVLQCAIDVLGVGIVVQPVGASSSGVIPFAAAVRW
jgi:hypothetical protein